jgi:DNA repair exonuclease SbcCD nuclease subunit
MKVAILTDTHFGARNDSHDFDTYFRKFYDEVFFPYLDKTQIKTLLHLGDVFDRRKYINFNTLRSCKEYFFEQLKKRDIDMKVIPGNHDTYYKNTNEVNSLDLLLREYSNIEIIEQPTVIELGGRVVSFIPWLCADNYDASMTVIQQPADVCFGHFEIAGFDMFRGAKNEAGMDRKVLKHFKKVLTGHFHHRSTDDNVYYLGSPYGFTWSDYDDKRGFHVLDTATLDLEFIENPFEIFETPEDAVFEIPEPVVSKRKEIKIEKNQVTLYEYRDHNININSYAYFLEGNLVVDYWKLAGSYEDEYFTEVKSENLQKLYSEFQIENENKAELLIGLLNAFNGEKCYDNIKEFFEQRDIAFQNSVRRDCI